MTIDEIVLHLGFCNGNYLITRFKKEFDVTPDTCRKQCLKSS